LADRVISSALGAPLQAPLATGAAETEQGFIEERPPGCPLLEFLRPFSADEACLRDLVETR